VVGSVQKICSEPGYVEPFVYDRGVNCDCIEFDGFILLEMTPKDKESWTNLGTGYSSEIVGARKKWTIFQSDEFAMLCKP
jgi:hypothetical protein